VVSAMLFLLGCLGVPWLEVEEGRYRIGHTRRIFVLNVVARSCLPARERNDGKRV
jgi:hypothetical protein